MDDLIKRSEAFDAIRQWVKMHQYYHPFSKGKTIPVDEAIDQLERVQAEQPSAQKTGKWIEREDPFGFFDTIPVCSECGHTTKMRERYNYCPNCGADMRGDEK